MGNVPEHHSKLEGEAHAGYQGRVNLFVFGNRVGVYNCLEGVCKVIKFEVGRRHLGMLDCRDMHSCKVFVFFTHALHCTENLTFVLFGGPKRTHQQCSLSLQLVKGSIDCFLFNNCESQVLNVRALASLLGLCQSIKSLVQGLLCPSSQILVVPNLIHVCVFSLVDSLYRARYFDQLGIVSEAGHYNFFAQNTFI